MNKYILKNHLLNSKIEVLKELNNDLSIKEAFSYKQMKEAENDIKNYNYKKIDIADIERLNRNYDCACVLYYDVKYIREMVNEKMKVIEREKNLNVFEFKMKECEK